MLMKFQNSLNIKTPRLILRPFKGDDLVDLNRYASVQGVGEMAGWPHHQTLEESQNILNMFIGEANVLALEKRDTGQVIGSLGVHDAKLGKMDMYKDKKIIEIGYVLAKDFWGQGLMSEAVKALLDHLFNVMGFDYVTVGHFIANTQSRRVIEKSGFIYHSDSIYEARQLNQSFAERQYIIDKETFNKL